MVVIVAVVGKTFRKLLRHVVLRSFEDGDAAVRVNATLRAADRADASGNRHVDLVRIRIGGDGMRIPSGDGLVCRDNVRIRLDVAAGLLIAMPEAWRFSVDNTEQLVRPDR